jgi:hypothetical protein
MAAYAGTTQEEAESFNAKNPTGTVDLSMTNISHRAVRSIWAIIYHVLCHHNASAAAAVSCRSKTYGKEQSRARDGDHHDKPMYTLYEEKTAKGKPLQW